MADDASPCDWEAVYRNHPEPYREVFRGVEKIYEDDRFFPGCLVLRGGGELLGIIPKENLLAFRRCQAAQAAVVPSRPSPLDLSRAARKDRP